MGFIGRLTVASLVLVAAACSDEDVAEQRRRLLEVDDEAEPARTKARPRLYDADGNLLPSQQRVAGLTLPRGLHLKHETDERKLFESRVPLEKLRAYFGPRLITGQVRAEGGSTTYLAAVPRGVQGGVVKLDVRIGANPSNADKSLVDIRERPAPPEQPLTEAQIRTQLEQTQKLAD